MPLTLQSELLAVGFLHFGLCQSLVCQLKQLLKRSYVDKIPPNTTCVATPVRYYLARGILGYSAVDNNPVPLGYHFKEILGHVTPEQ